MNSLLTLFWKELRELLRDRKTLFGIMIVPLVLYPLMGAAINVSRTSVEQAAAKATIAVMNLDGSLESQNLTLFLTLNAKVKLLEHQDVNQALPTLNEGNYSALLVIPRGYGYNLSQGLQGRLKVYALFKDLSVAEAGKGATASALLIAYRNILVVERIQEILSSSPFQGVNATSILDPVGVTYSSVFRGRAVNVDPSQLLNATISQSLSFPLIVMIMLIFAMQIAATSIALEKEEKTLETLLTLPMGRLTILTGKLAGSVALAGISAMAYLVGFSYYIGSIIGRGGLSDVSQADLQALGLVPSPGMYALLGLTVFVTVVSALALAVSLAVFADNVRSAQSLVGILFVPIMMPALILMFADIGILPSYLQWILYALPYTHTLLAIKAIFLGDVPVILRSIAYISAFTVVVLYGAAKIFTTERVITGRLFARRLRSRD
jgi:ABC-2 type transport system permease protein